MTEVSAGRQPSRPAAPQPPLRATGLTVFLGVLVVIMAIYTQMAMEMQWQTKAGRIGPGYFPRIVGVATVALCVLAAVRSLRPNTDAQYEEDEENPLGHHPRALLVLILAALGFVVVLLPLGAIVASGVFLLGTLWFLDRRHPKRNVAIAVLFPLCLYLLLQVALNAGLPKGILPML